MAHKTPWISFLYYWLPPFLWMMFIFSLSSRHSISVTHTFVYDFMIFKTLHVLEYAALFVLFFRAFHSTKLHLTLQFTYAIVCSIMFAATDEIHQLFVATRQGKIQDILIDTIGIILMYILVKKNLTFVKRFICK